MHWDTIWQDARFTLRTLRREPGFFAAALLIIAVGIGANTAIFSVVNGLLFRPLAFRDSDRLVWIENNGTGGMSSLTSRVSTYNEWRKATRTMEDLGAYFAFFDYSSYTLRGVGEPERLMGVGVSQNLLPFLDVKPALGRNFTEQEAQDNAPLSVILTHGLWQSRFGGSANIVGRQLTLNDKPATVVGVLPAGFDFSGVFVPGSRVDMLVPFPMTQSTDRWGNTLAIIGRLKPGVGIDAARAEFEVMNDAIRRADPQRWTFGSRLMPLREHLTGRFRRGLLILLCAVGGVLLIGCTNLSNLLLARATARRKEVAIRSALGATRSRLMRQMLTESLLLATCGAVAGVALAWLAIRALTAIQTIDMPLLRTVTIDGTALAFTALAALATGLLFGIVPALHSSGSNEAETLKDEGRGTSGSRRAGWTQRTLIVSEVALACVLLIGAGLLIRSFLHVLDIDLGFRPESATAWRIAAGEQRNNTALQSALYDRLVEAVEQIPGVVSAGVSDALPLSRDRSWGLGAPGITYPPGQYPIAHPRIIDHRYVKTMGIVLREGRDFSAHDRQGAEPVVILNEKAAKTLFPGQSAIGRMVRFAGDRKVVGVVANVRHLALEREGGLEGYIPVAQTGSNSVDLVVRSTLSPDALMTSVRRALHSVDPSLPTSEVQPLGGLVDRAVSPRRFMTSLLGAFAAGALLLAAIGIYGVVSYSVTQRMPELGIRMALGASPGHLQRKIVQETVMLVSTGLLIGVVAAFALTRLAESMLYGLDATDPVTFVTTVAILLAVAAIAGYLPALRASRLNPMSVLRSS